MEGAGTVQRKRKKPNTNIDRLSKPNKRFILALYEDYGRVLSPERIATVKQIIQEEYCMTPEDTEQYFERLRESHKRNKRETLAKKRNRLRQQEKLIEGKVLDVHYEFKKLLQNALFNQYYHRKPIMMTKRLKKLSDVILEQLVEITPDYDEIPDRHSTVKKDIFLIFVADWIAHRIESLYYDVYAKNFRAPLDEEERFERGADED